ncbi:hypothetical protein GTA08_BOTSDO08220 [Botryosphaeria dothidea]|uniref:Uncharacterized protein n=1 Tax=Botryosphaeria dothidea TaxID=55169 RepID=A0A8H4N025_9PEZI|nr:hypothetical protein GTA08_BOTSDO08220 [Botryosphaeria dothidea]
MSKMPLTRKTLQEPEERMLDWAIFRAPNLKIGFMGHIVPPNAVRHEYPLHGPHRPYQRPVVVSKYLKSFNGVFKKITDFLGDRLLLFHVARDQSVSPDMTLTSEE